MFIQLFYSIFVVASLTIWIWYMILYKSYGLGIDWHPISPSRMFLAVFFPILITRWGLKRKSLDMSGAVAAFVVGFILTISNLCFFASLLTFFVTASRLTKFRSVYKRKLEEMFKEGGQRNWVQVVANGGVATDIAIIFLIEVGCGEFTIDFTKHFTPSWLSLSVMGALACSCGDTYSSELGPVLGNSEPRLITNLRTKVPRGTNGGVSLLGTLSSAVGGAVVGMAFYAMLRLSLSEQLFEASPPQWPIVLLAAISGLLGSLIDSYLGATLQYSGFDTTSKCIVERPKAGVIHISGSPILDNHSVNLVASVITALLTPRIGLYLWKYIS